MDMMPVSLLALSFEHRVSFRHHAGCPREISTRHLPCLPQLRATTCGTYWGSKAMTRTKLPERSEFRPPVLEAFADKRVLVADNELAILRSLILALREQGIRVVRGAENGVEALEMHGQRPFHLIMLNHNMPRLKGVDVLKKLRGSGDTVPVIMHSASLSEADVRRLGLALNAFVDAPFPSFYLPVVEEVLTSVYGRGTGAA
jgi:CheY-like chemotaxis protein